MGIKKIVSSKTKEIFQNAMDIHEANVINDILSIDDFKPIKNDSPKEKKKIGFVVPELEKHSGGITSLLRLGTYLQIFGYDISFISFVNQPIDKMKEIAHYNLKSVKGNCISFVDATKEKWDIIIATSWISVYYSKKLSGYKMYFVQDFEPYFFKLSERYLLANKTYEQGFHIVSLGKWNLEQIHRNCKINSKMEYIDFPYEPNEYRYKERDFSVYKNKKNVKIAVYSKEDGKRIPNLLQGILYRTKSELLSSNIELEVLFFGFEKSYNTRIGTNLGKLSKSKMIQLYEECDFGMVASMTNISLVPYEMIGSGLPLIEFVNGSYSSFFGEGTAILVDFNYQTLVKAICENIESPDKLKEMSTKAYDHIKNLSWEKSARQFETIIESL